MKKKNTRIKHRKYNSRKKYIFPLVALSILLVVSVVGVFAASTKTEISKDGITYEVTKEPVLDGTTVETPGEVKITGFDKTQLESALTDGSLTIPGVINHEEDLTLDVTDDELQRVTYNVTSINDKALTDCPAKTIAAAADSKLTTIGANVFKDSSQLESVDFTNATNLTSIGDEVFANCEKLSSVKLPASLETLGNKAFHNCVNLQSVDFSTESNLESIGSSAFYNCPWLTEIKNLPTEAVIGDDAFWGCCYLTKDIYTLADTTKNPVFRLDAELRGTSISKIIPSDGNEKTPTGEAAEDNVPLRLFRGQEYEVTFNPVDERTIKGLYLLSSLNNLPTEYTITDSFEKQDSPPNTYTFTVSPDDEDLNADPIFLFAVATTGTANSGAPTIITDTLATANKGEPYEFQLKANPSEGVTWALEPADGASSALPKDFNFDPATGKITSTEEVTSEAGEYKFIAVATNDVSTHKKELTLKVFENKLTNFENNSLWWENRDGKTYVAWKPLVNPGTGNIKYTVQIYDEKKNPVGTKSKELQSSFTSEFAEIDVTSIINGKKGTYTYTITASNEDYGSSTADSSDTAKFPRGTYPYGYTKYTITAIASGGTGTGKISLSEESYGIPESELSVKNIDNGISVTVLETAVSEKSPLTFVFTPDQGCETTGLTVNGTAVDERARYTFTSLEKIQSSSTSNDSGIATADASDNVHDIVVEFSLISNSIGGGIMENSTYVQKEKVYFQAFGHNMDVTGVVKGNTRWVPDYWWLDDAKVTETTTKHTWKGEPYTDTIDTTNLSLGDHVLYVSFKQQTHNGANWVDSGSTDVRSATFTVTDKSGNTIDPDEPTDSEDSTDDADKDDEGAGTTDDENKDDDKETDDKKDSASDGKSSSGVGSVVDKVTSALSGIDTSDDMVMGLWVALALVSLVGIGFCIKQIIKFS